MATKTKTPAANAKIAKAAAEKAKASLAEPMAPKKAPAPVEPTDTIEEDDLEEEATPTVTKGGHKKLGSETPATKKADTPQSKKASTPAEAKTEKGGGATANSLAAIKLVDEALAKLISSGKVTKAAAQASRQRYTAEDGRQLKVYGHSKGVQVKLYGNHASSFVSSKYLIEVSRTGKVAAALFTKGHEEAMSLVLPG